jgi:hypothetical protein
MAKNLADELGPCGINVTCVHPGTTAHGAHCARWCRRGPQAQGTTEQAVERQMAHGNSICHLVDAAEVAHVVVVPRARRSRWRSTASRSPPAAVRRAASTTEHPWPRPCTATIPSHDRAQRRRRDPGQPRQRRPRRRHTPASLETASVSVFIRTGSSHESRRLNGISHFVEHMAFKGTHQRSCQQINLDAERLGADVNAHTDKDHTAYHMQGGPVMPARSCACSATSCRTAASRPPSSSASAR